MEMNVGVDFGSTYTTLSVYREDINQLEAMEEVDSPNIPSVAVRQDNKPMVYGRIAKKKTGKKHTKTFKAFKMLLPETNSEILASRGYEPGSMPVDVATGFLNYCLKMALKNFNNNQIDHLVICAPEIWTEAVSTADGRPILRDICHSFDYVKSVQVISEPCAASAFFAHNFETKTGKQYHGHILLVDYGGGTLDITLTEVYTKADKNGKMKMEIKVRERTGAGENMDGQIGKAGVAFMEAVVRKAIVDSGLADSEAEIPNDGSFLMTTDDLEEELISRVTNISETFDEIGIDEMDDLAEEEFATLEYNDEEIVISYATLVECYNRIIYPILAGKIQEMMDYMRRDGIVYDDSNAQNLKIALVGGFSNFYLVQQQIRDMFGFTQLDQRCKDIIVVKSDREQAVSFGAALISSGHITIRSTAPYSIGVCATRNGGVVGTKFAINFRQEIQYNQPYFQCSDDGEKSLFVFLNGGISRLIINTRQDIRGGLIIPLKHDLLERLQNLVTGDIKTAYVAFSMDESEVLSIHVITYDQIEEKEICRKTVELTRFNDLLEIAEAVPIVKE